MHVAVPKTGGDHSALAINDRGVAGDFDLCGWTDGEDAAVVGKD
jgi:hypothetical protein